MPTDHPDQSNDPARTIAALHQLLHPELYGTGETGDWSADTLDEVDALVTAAAAALGIARAHANV